MHTSGAQVSIFMHPAAKNVFTGCNTEKSGIMSENSGMCKITHLYMGLCTILTILVGN